MGEEPIKKIEEERRAEAERKLGNLKEWVKLAEGQLKPKSRQKIYFAVGIKGMWEILNEGVNSLSDLQDALFDENKEEVSGVLDRARRCMKDLELILGQGKN